MPNSLPVTTHHDPGHVHFDAADDHGLFGPARTSFDIRYIVAAIRSNVWLIAAIIAAALAIALVATLLQTPRYTAASTIQINDQTGRVMGAQEDNGDVNESNNWDTDRFLKTQTEILKSRGLALRVAQSMKLVGNPVFNQAQGVPETAPGMSAEAQRNLAVGLLRGGLQIELPRDSRIVSIQFESTDPQLAAQVANAYASEFIQSNLQRKFDSSAYARTFLSQQLDEAKIKLEASERALNAYSRDAGLIRTQSSDTGGDSKAEIGNGGSVTTSSLLQLNAAANEATARRIQAEERWRAVSSVALLSSSEVISNNAVSTLISQRAQVKAALDEDRARHLEDYPSVRARQSELAALDSQIQAAAGNVRNAVRGEYQSALAAERQLIAQVGKLKNETLGEQDKNVQYGLLSREAETNRQLYDGLLERYKTLNAVAGVSLSNVNVIDKAEPPGGPSSPNLFKNLLMGLILGVGLAALTVFAKDQFDDSIRVPEDVEAKLGLPLLGVIPRTHAA